VNFVIIYNLMILKLLSEIARSIAHEKMIYEVRQKNIRWQHDHQTHGHAKIATVAPMENLNR